MSIIVKVFREGHRQIAELCKGSTADSDSVCEGSNPSPAAKQETLERNGSRVFVIQQCLRLKARMTVLSCPRTPLLPSRHAGNFSTNLPPFAMVLRCYAAANNSPGGDPE